MLIQIGEHGRDRILFVVVRVQKAGIDHLSVAGVRFLFDVAALNDRNDLRAELFGEFPVALIVRGHRHDRAGAVAHHDVIRDKDRDLHAAYRIDRRKAAELHAGLFLRKLRALELGFLRACRAVRLDLVPVFDAVAVLVEHRMLRRNDHKRHAEQRVAARGVDFERFGNVLDAEVHERADGLADPVDLLLLDRVGIIDVVETFEQLIGVRRDLQIPDVLRELDDVAVAHVALAALRILVTENDLAVRAVVDERLCAEHEPVIEELPEDPLRPLVIIGNGRGDLARPVERIADALHLVLEMLDVRGRDDVRVRVGLDRVVLRGQTERVEAHREQHVIALHAALSGKHFQARIRLDMPDVHTRAGRVRKLHERVELRLRVIRLRLKAVMRVPIRLPLPLDGVEIVNICHEKLLSCNA